MKSVGIVYDISYQRLLEGVVQSRKDITKSVHTVTCSPPCTSRWMAELSDSEHDQVSLQDMSYSLELLSAMIDLGAHDLIHDLVRIAIQGSL